uniref:BED-type domain-containing protein n=1 Tax=Esox lucius TaxID=8010 RepID=A0AAY5L8P1_ESOLU
SVIGGVMVAEVTVRYLPKNVSHGSVRFWYAEAYLQFGFTVKADLRPQCVVCAEVLANDSMKPCKLKRHLETKHAGIKDKPAEYLKRKLDVPHQQQATISVHSTVGQRIAKLGKPHTIAETLILPAAQDMLGAVPLSNDTVARRISDMSNDIRDQLIEFIKKSPYFVLLLDESTDIAVQAQLLTYVRYLLDKAIEEDVLFGRPLQSHTTGEAIFNVLDLLKKFQFFFFDSVLNQSMKMINLKSRPLNFRLFGVLCQEMGSGHEQQLLHTEVRWLSKGRVLQRLYELREEVKYRVDAFTQKLDLWHGHISRGNCDMFPSLADFITDAGTSHDFSSLFQSASEHLSAMREQFATYFKEDYRSFACVRDPFVCTANELSIDMQEELIELKSDSRLKELFTSCPLSSFWAALMQEYPQLCDVALKIILPFVSRYLCEAGFSKVTALKTKYRNRAQIEDDLRLCLSDIAPRIEDLCNAKQAQISH